MDSLTKRGQPDRSKINMNEDFEVKYGPRLWALIVRCFPKPWTKWATLPPPFGRSWAF